MKTLSKVAVAAAFAVATFSLILVPFVEARGRTGSHRIGGYTSHGKGSHYVGGYVRSGSATKRH